MFISSASAKETKKKRKRKTHRENKKGSRDSSLSSSDVQCAPTKNIHNPLKKEKRGNTVC
jgi:hypothetical protein